MRLILGIIIGIAITIGAAYVRDSGIPESSALTAPATPTVSRRIVNWDVFGAVVDEQTAVVKGWWDKLVGKASQSSGY